MSKPLHLGFLYAPQSGHQTHDESFDPFNPVDLTTLAQNLEAADFAFLLIDDSVGQALPVRSEAFTTASFLATRTCHIGLIASANTSYIEPYNAARLAASLDHVTHGRAGWDVSTGALHPADTNYGQAGETADAHYDRADEIVGIARRLWDSWEDDAFVRDKQSGVFVDGAKIHAIDHQEARFNVKGPLNVARPPQGQVIVAHRVVDSRSAAFAGRHADIAILAAGRPENLAALRDIVVASASASNRDRQQMRLFAEVVAGVGPDDAAGAAESQAGHRLTGGPSEIADAIEMLADAAELDGLLVTLPVLRGGVDAFSLHVVPELARRQRLRSRAGATTLRERLGLQRPRNIFVPAATLPADTAA